MPTKLKPSMQKGTEPPFFDMPPLAFQDLCRDLVDVQEPNRNCRVYGDNGQSQLGIDIRCDRKSGVLEVAQAKCYRHFTPADIIKASNEFLEHLGYWQSEGVKKFILIVACRISSIQANDQIRTETNKFKELGIEYELWDAVRIRDILRSHNELIPTHISNPDYWISEIGGNLYKPQLNTQPSFTGPRINEMIVASFNNLTSKLNAKVAKELEENRILWNEGNGEAVTNWIKSIKSEDGEWDSLSAEVTASILRLEAIINIETNLDYEKAEKLLNDAKEIDPAGFDLRVRAILQLHRSGPQAGLDILGDSDDVDSLCVRASLLINSERCLDAIKILEAINESGKAEVHRLLALAYLNLRDLEKARREIGEAISIAPRWENVQIVDGIVSYFSALSPALLTHTSFFWPVPIEFSLLKTTNLAIYGIEKAASIFEKVASNPYRSEQDKLSLQIWHVACLACDFRKQELAKQLFEDLLEKHPTDYRLIYWALSRGYSSNLARSYSELKKLWDKRVAKIEHIISGVMLAIHFKRFRNIFYLLDNHRRIFVDSGDEYLWEFWYIQALLAAKRLSDARKRIEETRFSPIVESLELALLHDEGESLSADARPYVELLLKVYGEGKQPIYLWELCTYYASKNQWEKIVPLVEKLVVEIQTLESLRLSSVALHKKKKYQECKQFIEQYKSLCFQEELPDDLHLIYITSKALSGGFTEAIKELRLLTEHSPTRQNIILLRDFYLQKGDQDGLRYVASVARRNENILPGDIISIAESMLWVSRDLAEEMWRMAAPEQLSSQKLVEKMSLGFALGLDHEMKDLSKQVFQIAETRQTTLKQATKEEVIQIIQEENRQKNELFRLYSDGEIPIHVLTGNTGFNLFAVYKNIIRDNSNLSTETKGKFPIYIRFGGKTDPRGFDVLEPIPVIENLTLDVTSILLLDHFSLLSTLETEVNSLYLPSNTVLALVQMKDALLRYQPEVVRASKLISDLIGEKRIREIAGKHIVRGLNTAEEDILQGFMQNIEQEDGHIIGFDENLATWNSMNLSNGRINFATCRDVIESLRNIGAITESERILGIERLGTSGQTQTDKLITTKSNLFFMANTITQIAQTGIFEQLCSNFNVWVESEEVLRVRTAIRDERDRLSFANALQTLIEKINKGIDNGKYVFIPQPQPEIDNKTEGILFDNLIENIYYSQGQNSFPVIDDHNIQKNLNTRGVPYYGIFEVLSWLHNRKVVDDPRYYGVINEFRRADLRYIPVTKDEILFHIRKVGIDNIEQIDSDELKTLRSYISASLVYGKKPQIPIQPNNTIESLGEMEYLFSLMHAISYAIVEIWQDDVQDDLKISRSAWIINNLYLDMLSICKVIGWERATKDHLFLVSLGLAEFFLNGLQFHIKLNSDIQKRYFSWIYQAVCEPRFNVNPGLLDKTVDYIKKSLSNLVNEKIDPDADKVKAAVINKIYDDLPAPIKESINKDQKFLRMIGVQIITATEVADIIFPAKILWNKLSDVLSGEVAVVRALSPDVEIQFLPFDSDTGKGISFVHPLTKQNINISSPDFAFLRNKDFDVWIDENIENFSEINRKQLQDEIEQISQKSVASERLELLDKFRQNSIGNAYKVFEEELENRQTLVFEQLLPPSATSSLSFFGFDQKSKKIIKVADLFANAAKHLIDQHGLVVAITRLSSFPVELPDILLEEIRLLSTDEREIILSELSDHLVTPMARIHLIRILGEFPDIQERLSIPLNSFFSVDSRVEFSAFSALLVWITNALDSLKDIRKLDDRTKLLIAWGHSNCLFSIIKRRAVPLDWLNDVVRENRPSSFYKKMLFERPKLWDDLACGEKIDFLAFKILGFDYAFQNRSLPDEFQKKLFKEAFPHQEKTPFPAVELLRDRSDLTNCLDSFLSKELSEVLLHLTSASGDMSVNNPTLREFAFLAISSLADPKSAVLGWQLLIGMYPTQIIPKELRQQFESSIVNYSYVDLAQDQAFVAYLALHFSSRQAQFLNETNRSHLKDEILKLAEISPNLFRNTEADENQPFGQDEAISFLSEASIQMALTESNQGFSYELSTLLREIVARWRDARTYNLRLLNVLIGRLPIPVAQGLAEVLVELRSIK